MKNLKLALQNKGRLSEESFNLLQNAGLKFETSSRSLSIQCQNFPLELLFLRAEDIPEVVADGVADIGICGENSIEEKGFSLETLVPLDFGKCRLALAVPEKTNGDFSLKKKRIATSYPNILNAYLKTCFLWIVIILVPTCPF